eukprot:364521-Chlamydomonas_euryale.AAC.7
MINVNAVDAYNNRVPKFTNYGANSTHLFAPGVNVVSTYPRNRCGTSVGSCGGVWKVTHVHVDVRTDFAHGVNVVWSSKEWRTSVENVWRVPCVHV